MNRAFICYLVFVIAICGSGFMLKSCHKQEQEFQTNQTKRIEKEIKDCRSSGGEVFLDEGNVYCVKGINEK